MSGRDSNTVYVVVIGADLDEPVGEHVFSIRSDAEKAFERATAQHADYEVALEEWQRGRSDGEQFIGTLA